MARKGILHHAVPQEDLPALIRNIRKRLAEYRATKDFQETSIHLNAIDIVLALTEFSIRDKRVITVEERRWFLSGLYVSYVLGGSEWEDISDNFTRLVNAVTELNYLEKVTRSSQSAIITKTPGDA